MKCDSSCVKRFGTPKDFWPIAVASFLSTAAVAGICIEQVLEDPAMGRVNVSSMCWEQSQGLETGDLSLLNGTGDPPSLFNETAHFSPHYPAPTLSGFFGAFGTVMYAFNFVPVFPTIQAHFYFCVPSLVVYFDTNSYFLRAFYCGQQWPLT